MSVLRGLPHIDTDGFEAVAVENLGLPVQRQLIGIFADQHMRQQAGAGPPALDWV